MKKILAKARTAIAAIGRGVRKVLPKMLLGREKAVAGFLTPLVLVQLARFVPSLHVSPTLAEQLVLAIVTSVTVHGTTNTPTNNPPEEG